MAAFEKELFSACAFGHEDRMHELIRADKGLLEARDEVGRTPLAVAAMSGHLGIVQSLLDAGADPNAKDIGGRTAFLWAAAEGRNGVLLALAQRTTESSVVTAASGSGNSALHRAAAYGFADTCRVLLGLGCKGLLEARNAEGLTPLLRGARWGHADVVGALLGAGADVEAVDAEGRGVDDWVARKGHVSVGEVLVAWREKDAAGLEAERRKEAEREGEVLEAAGKEVAADAVAAIAKGKASGGGGGGEGDTDEEDDGEGDDPDVSRRGRTLSMVGGHGLIALPMRVEGWMAKQGHFIPNWKNRWFVLEEDTIHYYGRQGDVVEKGRIHLTPGTEVIILPPERSHKPNCFSVNTPKKRFLLQAADEEERDEWVAAIKHNLKVCR